MQMANQPPNFDGVNDGCQQIGCQWETMQKTKSLEWLPGQEEERCIVKKKNVDEFQDMGKREDGAQK